MYRRFLAAVPLAAVAALALLWTMNALVPTGRPEVRYTVFISDGARRVAMCRWDCGKGEIIDIFPNTPERPEEPDPITQLPAPPRPEPDPGEPPKIPHEPLPEPPGEIPDLYLGDSQGDECHDSVLSVPRFVEPKQAHADDYVVVEILLGPDGHPKDVQVVQSSNPNVNDEVTRWVEKWQYKLQCLNPDSRKEPFRVRIELVPNEDAG